MTPDDADARGPTRAQDRVVERIRRVCLDLPEAVEKPFGGHSSPAFRVRDKLFVMIAEARTSMTLKAPKGAQEILVNADPERFFVPPYVGPKGWIGVQIALKKAPDWDEVAELICESYCLTAPKRLVAQWEAGRED